MAANTVTYQTNHLSIRAATVTNRRPVVFDVDNDGNDDFVWPVKEGDDGGVLVASRWNVSLGDFEEIILPISWSEWILDPNSSKPWLFAADFDQDGVDDLLVGDRTGWRVFRRKGGKGDLLTAVRTTLEAADGEPTIEIEYATAATAEVYSPGPSFQCPEDSICSTPSRMLVKRAVDRGVTPIQDRVYSYSGAASHRKGRGWLGFSEVKWEDQNTGVSEQRLYEFSYDVELQDFPLRNSPYPVHGRAPPDGAGGADRTWTDRLGDVG